MSQDAVAVAPDVYRVLALFFPPLEHTTEILEPGGSHVILIELK